MKNRTKRIDSSNILHLGIVLIILISFFLFSTAFYPFISSDDALNVLMANDYHLPHDLYCWGQDRGGTLIPFISQLFIVPFDIPAYYAVSISNYIILTLGFCGFSTLIKDKKIVLLLALFLFFPYQRFLQVTVFPIGMGYSLLGFSLLFVRKINWQKNLFLYLPNLIRMGVISLIWLLAVWSSDLVFVTLLTLGGTIILYIIQHRKNLQFKAGQVLLAYSGILISLFLIIQKAKSYATTETEQFFSFNTLGEIGSALKIVKTQSLKVLLGGEDILLMVGGWIIVCILCIGIFFIIRYRKSLLQFEQFALNFFLFEGIAMLFVIFLSHWVLLNEMGRWYFVAPYVAFGLLFILLIDHTNVLATKRKYYGALFIFILLGCSNISNVMYHSKGKYIPATTTISELNQLGEIGIIGNYWEAYRMAIVNPDQIKSTPFEGGGVRSEKLVQEVFNQPKIYISQDMWFDVLPDTLVQFGVTLVKKGKKRQIAGSTICEYVIQRKREQYYLNDLKYLPEYFNPETNTIELKSTQTSSKGKLVVFGPYTSILPGKYKLFLSAVGQVSPQNAENIQLDISHNHGVISSGFEPLTELPVEYTCEETIFEKAFETKELMQHVEFRILVKEPVDFTFYKFELIPVK